MGGRDAFSVGFNLTGVTQRVPSLRGTCWLLTTSLMGADTDGINGTKGVVTRRGKQALGEVMALQKTSGAHRLEVI